MTSIEQTDVVVVGSGFGGAIPAYHLAAGGARVVVLERGPWLASDEFDHDFLLGSSYTRIFDFTVGDGMSVLAGNCVGGGSVVYFATMPRAPGSSSSAAAASGGGCGRPRSAGTPWTRGTTWSAARCR